MPRPRGVSLHVPAVRPLVKTQAIYGAFVACTVSHDVLRQPDHDCCACFAARDAWNAAPSPLVARPRLPGYTDKHKGHNLLLYDLQAMSLTGLRRGEVIPSQLSTRIRSRHTTEQQARSVPRTGDDVVVVVDARETLPAAVDPSRDAGIDRGVNTLAALMANQVGCVPRLVHARPVKSSNQVSTTRTAPVRRLKAYRTRQSAHSLHPASSPASWICW